MKLYFILIQHYFYFTLLFSTVAYTSFRNKAFLPNLSTAARCEFDQATHILLPNILCSTYL